MSQSESFRRREEGKAVCVWVCAALCLHHCCATLLGCTLHTERGDTRGRLGHVHIVILSSERRHRQHRHYPLRESNRQVPGFRGRTNSTGF